MRFRRNLFAASHLDPTASSIWSHMWPLTLWLLLAKHTMGEVSLFLLRKIVNVHFRSFRRLMKDFLVFQNLVCTAMQIFHSALWFFFCFISGFHYLLMPQFSFSSRVLAFISYRSHRRFRVESSKLRCMVLIGQGKLQ